VNIAYQVTGDGLRARSRTACATSGSRSAQALHTGECEVMDGKVSGIAVHIGARVARQADPGEVLVSSTVKDLVASSGRRFRERGTTDLKGVPEQWRLYAVERA
jgi:class 3 adenylate cyclase